MPVLNLNLLSTCIPNMNILSEMVQSGDIFDEKILRNYGRTDGRTDRCKPVYPPPTFSKREYNKIPPKTSPATVR